MAKDIKDAIPATTEVLVTLRESEVALVLSDDTLDFAKTAFLMQNDIENESKFIRGFAYDAFKSRLAYMANSAKATWNRAVEKHSIKHPTWTREAVITDLLEARSYREMYDRSVNAEQVVEKL